MHKPSLQKSLIIILITIAVVSTLFILYQNKERNTINVLLDIEFKLRISEKAFIKDAEVTVTFIRVVEDSRCPSNVYCFWAGRATVELSFTKNNKEIGRVNLTIPGDEEKEFDGYVIRLIRIEPQREYPEKMQISPSDYRITLIISKKTT